MAIYYPFDLSLVSEWPGTRPAGWAPHWGTDFAVPSGTSVPATGTGTIVRVGDDGLGGFTIDLVDDSGLLHRFGHLTWRSARVSVGQRVAAGQVIALSGNSGASLGPHLHWELRWDRLWSWGAWVDPRSLNPRRLGSSAPTPIKQTGDCGCARRRIRKGQKEMHLIFLTKGARQDGSPAYAIYEPGQQGSWEEFDNTTAKGKYANALAAQFGTPMEVSLKKWLDLQKKYKA